MAEVSVQKKEKESVWSELQKMEERIMRRAYEIFRRNGSIFGRDLDNWLEAERELIWKPAVEITEKDNEFEIRVAVAGVEPKDLNVEITPEQLVVKGETKFEKEERKGQVHYSEFRAGSLYRAIDFPRKVDPNKVKAEVKNGVLTVTANIAEAVKGRKVDVHAA